MTVKTSEIVIDALEDLVVQADEAPIEQSEARAAIRMLNDMMNAWAVQGIDLGYTQVSDMADPITVPLGAIMGIKKNLAILLAPKYNVPVTPELRELARIGYSAIVDIVIDTSAMEYPDTLPQGSGQDYPGYADTTFYPDQESTILTETGGSIALEDDTEEA